MRTVKTPFLSSLIRFIHFAWRSPGPGGRPSERESKPPPGPRKPGPGWPPPGRTTKSESGYLPVRTGLQRWGPEGGAFRSDESDIAAIRKPNRPPTAVNVSPSTRICPRTWRRRAPMDFRIPISRVRSATETSMMFITPTAPMLSVRLPMMVSRTLSPRLRLVTVLRNSFQSRMTTARSSRAPK